MKKLTILKIVSASTTYLFLIACLITAMVNVDLLTIYTDLITYVIYCGVFTTLSLVIYDEFIEGGE